MGTAGGAPWVIVNSRRVGSGYAGGTVGGSVELTLTITLTRGLILDNASGTFSDSLS